MHYRNKENRFIKAGQRAGLKFESGWLFLQAVGTEFINFKPVVLQNEDGDRAPIGAQTAAVTTDEILDSNDNKVLEPDDNDRNTVFQIMYGIAPSRMQVFRLYGRERNEALEDYDEPEDPAPILTGFDSPYNNPTRESELWYVNDMAPLRFQAFNPMDEAKEAVLSFHVNKVRYQAITDRGLMKAMLQSQTPARLVNMGEGVQNRNQVPIPEWISQAFGEHVYSTTEILQYDGQGGTNQQEVVPSPADLRAEDTR